MSYFLGIFSKRLIFRTSISMYAIFFGLCYSCTCYNICIPVMFIYNYIVKLCFFNLDRVNVFLILQN